MKGLIAILIVLTCSASAQKKYDAYRVSKRVEYKITYGMIDARGRQVVPFDYINFLEFSEDGIAVVEKDDKWGAIDNKGNIIIEPQYERLYGFHNGFCFADLDGKQYLIDKNNKRHEVKHANVWGEANDQLIPIKLNDKVGYVDWEGNVVIPADHKSDYYRKGQFINGYATMISGDGDYLIYNMKGDVILRSMEMLTPWNGEGLIRYNSKSRKSGYLNRRGSVMVEPKYTTTYDFKNGVGGGETRGMPTEYFDEMGKKLSDADYAKAVGGNWAYFDSGKRKWGVKDANNEWVLDAAFDQIEVHDNGMITTTLVDREKQYPQSLELRDANGKLLKTFERMSAAEPFDRDLMRMTLFHESDAGQFYKVYDVMVNKYGKMVWKSEMYEGGCFPTDALVSMSEGTEKPISELIKGDVIVSSEGTTTVLEVETHQGLFPLTSVSYETSPQVYAGELLGAPSVRTFEATPNHPVMTLGGIKPMGKLSTQDVLLYYDAETGQTIAAPVTMVISESRRVGQVFNLKTTSGSYHVSGAAVLMK